MSRLKLLRSATSLRDVANILNFKQPRSLTYILYKMSAAEKYTKFEIPKKSGGIREIYAPKEPLKRTQSTLANLLQDCIDEINAFNGREDTGKQPDRISHGFKRRRSIITNAQQHRNRRYVFNVDIENFFGSINFGRVRGFLIKDKNFSLHPDVATVIAQIACIDNHLPQGSPCSPVISNLIGHVLDIHLAKLSLNEGTTYTRYADDLTFSTNKKIFPEKIAALVGDGNKATWAPGQELIRIIEKSGFKLNIKKTRMQYRDSQQIVTGLVVNKKISVPHQYRHLVRAMVNRLLTTGGFEFEDRSKDLGDKKFKTTSPGNQNQLRGMIDFIVSVDRHSKVPSKDIDLNGFEKLYRSFLLYKEFYATDKPLLICEGKTDNVYLAHAARSLYKTHPILAKKSEDGKITLQFKRHRYPSKKKGIRTARLLNLNGGTADLKQFIVNYHATYNKIKAPIQPQPVIIVVDNDSGANKIFSYIKSTKNIANPENEDFIHLFGNLYLVATPRSNGKPTAIEDLFDTKTKSILIGGKSFDSSNEHDTSTHYGKSVFAHRIVEPQAESIDFSGFSVLLHRIEAVIKSATH